MLRHPLGSNAREAFRDDSNVVLDDALLQVTPSRFAVLCLNTRSHHQTNKQLTKIYHAKNVDGGRVS